MLHIARNGHGLRLTDGSKYGATGKHGNVGTETGTGTGTGRDAQNESQYF